MRSLRLGDFFRFLHVEVLPQKVVKLQILVFEKKLPALSQTAFFVAFGSQKLLLTFVC